jgi:hypothetical protein
MTREMTGGLAIVRAKHAGDSRLNVRFANGSSGVVDFASLLWGPMFAPLRDTTEFRRFRVSRRFGTIVWKNGADVGPEWVWDRFSKTRRGEP